MPAQAAVLDLYEKFIRELQDLRGVASLGVAGRGSAPSFDREDFLAESMLLRAHRAFEHLVEEVFLLYCLGEPTLGKTPVLAHIRPIDKKHARDLIKFPSRWVEWGNPDTLIQVSSLFLKDGFPIKDALTSNLVALNDIRRLRNFIAHSSVEAEGKYRDILKRNLGTVPLNLPPCGGFLRMRPTGSSELYLEGYLTVLETVGAQIVEKPL